MGVDVEVGDRGAGKGTEGLSKPVVAKLCVTLQPREQQHTRFPCPSRVCSDSCPLSR